MFTAAMFFHANVINALARLNILQKTPATEDKRHLDKSVFFYGDLPRVHRAPAIGTVPADSALNKKTGKGPCRFVCSRDFSVPRPYSEQYKNVLYRRDGFAWVNAKLDERLSARRVRSLRPLLDPPHRAGAQSIKSATLIQSEWPDTYGDWVSEHIRCIALAGGIVQPPLVLPEFLAKRGYVRHELDRLGIETLLADSNLHIEEATILRKPTPLNFWKRHEVAAYRKLFDVSPTAPEPGSIIYLSRAGVTSEQIRAERTYRSDEIAEVVRRLGGTVVETASMRIEDFATLADKAETVIGDHGAAMFNMMQWRPKRIIEIVTDNWWSSCFVHLGLACDAKEHIVLRCNQEAFIKRLETVISDGVILPENGPVI